MTCPYNFHGLIFQYMQSEEIRKNFLEFFKKRDHTTVPSSSLIPDDPSVLLTTAGMQQFKRYFTGDLDPIKNFGSKNTVSIQKSFRTSDIDEVGDASHLTFFEMLGNFSFGGYFKEEAIKYAYEFITEVMKLPIDYVSIFEGDPSKSSGSAISADTESEKIWRSLGVKNIKKFGREDNFWGPTGAEGPCGPTTEIYINNVEIWNIVFNEFYCNPDKSLKKLETPGVDTGMGLERLAMASQGVKTIFETDLFSSLIASLPTAWTDEKIKRILADHGRAVCFLISDGVRPSNKEAGYILRRLLRRAIIHLRLKQGGSFQGADTLSIGVEKDMMKLLGAVYEKYNPVYEELNLKVIGDVFREEYEKFSQTLHRGLRELRGMKEVSAKNAFDLYQTFGLPYEAIRDIAGKKAANLNREDFDKEFDKHRKISRAGLERKFGGHGLVLDTGELKAADDEEFQKVLRLHTATHILQAALRKVLGSEVEQRGSDINAKRARFDFSFSRKMTDEEKRKAERVINDIIEADLPVQFVELPKEEAEKTGALFFFKQKYPEVVKVYYIGDSLKKAVSKEFCGGPHVKQTSEIGRIKILKEESVGAGTRRIKIIIK